MDYQVTTLQNILPVKYLAHGFICFGCVSTDTFHKREIVTPASYDNFNIVSNLTSQPLQQDLFFPVIGATVTAG